MAGAAAGKDVYGIQRDENAGGNGAAVPSGIRLHAVPQDAGGKIDENGAAELIDAAIRNGVNYLDTAYPYHEGASEPFMGRLLKRYDRKRLYLATKLPMWLVKSLEDAKRLFKEQLERLQVDYIDFIFCTG